ncbi:MAG: sigma-70 family RNA polymerase sigma factor [Eubacteriales bacterium]|nr:sigma-70 family RNA polymerase sigma factor [Eubacteriales bacterium]
MADEELFIKYKQNPTIELRNEIVEKYLYMVDILIRKYTGKGVEYDDLKQVGALALVQAVERFDPDRGFTFSAFATPTIVGEIKKYFRDKQWSLKVPRRVKEMSGRVQQARDKFFLENHREPNIKDLAEATGFSDEDIVEVLDSSNAYTTYSLNKTFDDDGEDSGAASLEKYTGFDEKGFTSVEINDIIQKVLKEFPDDDRYIFRERVIFGRSQADIAKTLGISQMTVSRTERKIKERLQEEFSKE